ncbi:Proteasome activator complex subunit 4 [Eumeta japonica]|uniref:Proteasome activator complex subunit 4 n=1 Tax=Eumeta variegata TaxID=151549 RepID=A0A4C1WWA3_EUMVA|nr:Proteasome activator complex subunit 4 [Eumeta japonica]
MTDDFMRPLVLQSYSDWVESLVPATSFPLTSGIDHFITLDGKNIRLEIIQLLNLVQEKMLKVKSDDTKGFEKLIQLWDRVGGVRSNRSGIHLEARMRSYAALERALDGKGGPLGGGRIRTLLADAARLQDEARADLQSDAGIGNVGLIILNALYELSINTYTSVRRLAQMRLNSFLSHYAYSYRILLPKLTSLLEIGGEGDEWHAKHKGALYIMLGSRMGPLVAKQDWDLIKTLWPAILKSPLSEKPSILRPQTTDRRGAGETVRDRRHTESLVGCLRRNFAHAWTSKIKWKT